MKAHVPLTGPTAADAERADATTRRLRVGWHPIQLQALTILTERVASPKEVAIELGMTGGDSGTVSYHIRALEKSGLVEEVRTEPRRGALEHFFKAVERPIVNEEDWRKWTFEQRDEFSRYVIQQVAKDFGNALANGTLDADEFVSRHLTRTPLCLDGEGFRDLLAGYMELFEQTFKIQAESDERRSRSGEEGVPVSSILATVPMPMVETPSTNRRA
jgi:DNA-binding transcriptional ArsR family regulator